MEIRPPRGMDRGFPLSFSRRIWYTILCYEFHKERGWTVGNVTLIGMPGSGKSTVGVLLAKALGYGFLDTDLVIQQQEGALLQEILDEKGVPYFLDADRPRGQRGLPGGGHRPPEGRGPGDLPAGAPGGAEGPNPQSGLPGHRPGAGSDPGGHHGPPGPPV